MNGKKLISLKLKSIQEREKLISRSVNHIAHTPAIIIQKLDENVCQLWVDELEVQILSYLKSLNDKLSIQNARLITQTCEKISNCYCYFILKNNLVFQDKNSTLIVWINPIVYLNQPTITLPNNQDGEYSMVASIIFYFKQWVKIENSFYTNIRKLSELSAKFCTLTGKQRTINSKMLISNKRYTYQVNSQDKQSQEERMSTKLNKYDYQKQHSQRNKMLLINDKNSDLGNSLNNNGTNEEKTLIKTPSKNKIQNNRRTINTNYNLSHQSQRSEDNSEHFSGIHYYVPIKNTNLNLNINSNNHLNTVNTMVNNELSPKQKTKNNNYFPYKTTSSTLKTLKDFVSVNINPSQQFKNNKIILEVDKLKQSDMKSSLGLLAQQLDSLFHSNISNKQQDIEELQSKQKQFEDILS